MGKKELHFCSLQRTPSFFIKANTDLDLDRDLDFERELVLELELLELFLLRLRRSLELLDDRELFDELDEAERRRLLKC